jgi:hypothetical protein
VLVEERLLAPVGLPSALLFVHGKEPPVHPPLDPPRLDPVPTIAGVAQADARIGRDDGDDPGLSARF